MSRRLVLITGAAGRVGRELRQGLSATYALRLLDRLPLPDEPMAIQADITNLDALCKAMDGVDTVVHLAAHAWEGDFNTELLPRNIVGAYNVFEAARRMRVRRIVFASTYHVVETYSPLTTRLFAWPGPSPASTATFPLSVDVPVRPDGMYAVTKVFGEAVARYYADFHGVSSVCLRLGAVGPKSPAARANPRSWSAWLAPADLCHLVARAIEAEVHGCVTVYGISRNTRRLYDLEPARRLLGYEPQDDSELHLADWYRDGLVPPPPMYIPYGERLAELLVPPERTALCWLGQASFYVKTPATSFCIDPFLTVWHDTLQRPLLTPSELTTDLILITHHHRDHLDRHALPVIASAHETMHIAGPPSCCQRLVALGISPTRLLEMPAGKCLQWHDTEVVAVRTRHTTDSPDALGYVLKTPAVTLYHTGDTEYDPALIDAQHYHPDVVLVPIDGRGGNMTAEQAARLIADLLAPYAVPMHYGMVQPQADLLDRFLTALTTYAPHARAAVMSHGAIVYLPFASRKEHQE